MLKFLFKVLLTLFAITVYTSSASSTPSQTTLFSLPDLPTALDMSFIQKDDTGTERIQQLVKRFFNAKTENDYIQLVEDLHQITTKHLHDFDIANLLLGYIYLNHKTFLNEEKAYYHLGLVRSDDIYTAAAYRLIATIEYNGKLVPQNIPKALKLLSIAYVYNNLDIYSFFIQLADVADKNNTLMLKDGIYHHDMTPYYYRQNVSDVFFYLAQIELREINDRNIKEHKINKTQQNRGAKKSKSERKRLDFKDGPDSLLTLDESIYGDTSKFRKYYELAIFNNALELRFQSVRDFFYNNPQPYHIEDKHVSFDNIDFVYDKNGQKITDETILDDLMNNGYITHRLELMLLADMGHPEAISLNTLQQFGQYANQIPENKKAIEDNYALAASLGDDFALGELAEIYMYQEKDPVKQQKGIEMIKQICNDWSAHVYCEANYQKITSTKDAKINYFEMQPRIHTIDNKYVASKLESNIEN